MDIYSVVAIMVLRPSPTGNILRNGDMIIKSGKSKKVIKRMLKCFCLTRTKRLINPKYTGMMKKLAPLSIKARAVHIISHNSNGGTAKLAVFSGL